MSVRKLSFYLHMGLSVHGVVRGCCISIYIYIDVWDSRFSTEFFFSFVIFFLIL